MNNLWQRNYLDFSCTSYLKIDTTKSLIRSHIIDINLVRCYFPYMFFFISYEYIKRYVLNLHRFLFSIGIYITRNYAINKLR